MNLDDIILAHQEKQPVGLRAELVTVPMDRKPETIEDGYHVLAWPETVALVKLLGGPDLEKLDEEVRRLSKATLVTPGLLMGVEFTLTEDRTSLIVGRAGAVYVQKTLYQSGLTGFEVYRTETFKAFCRRLGVAWQLPTKDITVRVYGGEQPLITQSYAASTMYDLYRNSAGEPLDPQPTIPRT